jgi:hypothetical protein
METGLDDRRRPILSGPCVAGGETTFTGKTDDDIGRSGVRPFQDATHIRHQTALKAATVADGNGDGEYLGHGYQ